MNALIDLGAWTLEQVRHVGRMAIFALQLFKELPASLARFWLVVQQIHFIGNYSLLIIAVSGLFVGFVLALQGYYILVSYGSEQALGVMVALSLARELGPVVAALLFAGRAGSYQRYQGRKLSDRFDAYSYWYLTWTVDSHNVGRGRGGVEAALSGIRAHCTVIGIDSDCLFPIGEQRYIAEHIPGAEFHEVVSRFGHDGFLLEYQQISEIVSPVLGRLETGS